MKLIISLKVKLLFALIFFNCYRTASAQSTNIPKKYIAYKTTESPIIDGIADENIWEKALWTDNFIDIEGIKTPKYKTNLKIIWDEKYLYFYAKLEEPNVWATLKKRDTVIFYNNDFEIFIDPNGDTHNYMEFEMNALNTVWDLFLTKPYRDGATVLNSWDIKGLISAVYIEGTLNNVEDIDRGWSVEIALPWKVLTEANSNNAIPINEFWRLNFSRVNWDHIVNNSGYSRKKDENGKYLPEYNWVWSPQGVINMHEPEKWGYVYFSPKNIGDKDNFIIPSDEKIKWRLYELYRKQKSFYDSSSKWITQINELIDNKLVVEGKTLTPKLENHLTGWNISVKSPFTGNICIIRHDGKYSQIKNQ